MRCIDKYVCVYIYMIVVYIIYIYINYIYIYTVHTSISDLLCCRRIGGLSQGLGQSAAWKALALGIKFPETVSKVQQR
jgi:hypothetical protein